MSLPEDQVRELKSQFPDIASAVEANVTYISIPKVKLPKGCTPEIIDVLLCPSPREGYSSRLFFSERVTSHPQLNWQPTVRILEKTWHVFSWQSPPGLRLAQMLAVHLKAFR